MTGCSPRNRWTLLLTAALVPASALVAHALPPSGGAAAPALPGNSGPLLSGSPQVLLAQGFGQGMGFGQGLGQGVGQSFGQGFGQRGGGMFPQVGGQQGGVFPTGGTFSLAPGRTTKLMAFCTDLLSEPPDGTTRFRGGKGAQVALADGTVLPLDQALSSGQVALNGKEDTFDPFRRAGSLALDLYLTNTSPLPARVILPTGTAVAPRNGAEQPLPAGSERLFALAKTRFLSRSNTMQFAVWAARGSTAEEVEQTQMVRLSQGEVKRVQDLLDQSGIRQTFDRNRGLYADRYDTGIKSLGEKTEPVEGTAFLATGTKAAIAGVRNADGKGYVTIKPLKKGGEYFYQAEFEDRKDGRVAVKLIHLATGRPARANQGRLLLTPG